MKIPVDFSKVSGDHGYPIEWFLERAGEAKTTDKGYKVNCPAHGGDGLNLSLNLPDAARPFVGLTCHSMGCSWKEIVASFEAVKPDQSHGRIDEPKLPVRVIRGDPGKAPLDWYAHYLGVSRDVLKSYEEDGSLSERDTRVFHNIREGLAKTRDMHTLHRNWEPTGAKQGTLVWPPLPDHPIKDFVISEGEPDTIIMRLLAFAAHTFGSVSDVSKNNYVEIVSLLERWEVERVIICLDADLAGRNAATNLAKHLIRSGFEVVTLDIRSLLVNPRREKDIRDLWKRLGFQLKVELKRLIREFEESVTGYDALSYAEKAIGEIPWILEPIIVEGGFSLYYAPAKKGKSTFNFALLAVLDQALRSEIDVSLLGKKVKACSAVYMTEDSPWPWRSKTETHFRAGEGRHVYVMPHSDWIEKSWEEKFQAAIRLCKRTGSRLLIIDTIMTWARITDENDAPTIYEALDLIRAMCAREHIACLGVHYHTKDGSDRGARGSGAWEAIPDILISMEVRVTKAGERRVMTFKTKIGMPPSEIIYRLETDEDDARYGQLVLDTPEVAITYSTAEERDVSTRELSDTEVAANILEFLDTHEVPPQGWLYKDIAHALGRSGVTGSAPYKGTLRAIKILLTSREIEITKDDARRARVFRSKVGH